MTHRLFLFIIMHWTTESLALSPIPNLMEPAVAFFRSPESRFPSGHTTLSHLVQQQISSRVDTWYEVDRNGHHDWIAAPHLIYLRDFIRHSPEEQTGFTTARTKTLRKKTGWIPGPLIDEGSRLTITSVRSDWACGHDSKGEVCVPSDKVLIAIDAAHKVETSQGRWHPVKHRISHQMITQKGQVIPLHKVKSWEAHPRFAFLKPSAIGPSQRQGTLNTLIPYERVLLLKKELRRWNQSLLLDHGNVWWQKSLSQTINPIILTADDLSHRPVSAESRSKNLSLLSADGVFFSTDGVSWEWLKRFGENNYPVAIGPKDTLIVGDQISLDQGQTFQSYLRWDEVIEQTQKILKHPPKHLRLLAIKGSSSPTLRLDIDTGYKALVFEVEPFKNRLTYKTSYLIRGHNDRSTHVMQPTTRDSHLPN